MATISLILSLLVFSLPALLVTSVVAPVWSRLFSLRLRTRLVVVLFLFFLLWQVPDRATVAIVFGVGLPFLLIGSLLVDAQLRRERVVLRVLACLLALALFVPLSTIGGVALAALLGYLLAGTVPGHTFVRVDRRILGSLLFAAPVLALG
jgi:hypothetical protein